MERIRATVKGREAPLKTSHGKMTKHFAELCRSNKTLCQVDGCEMYGVCQTMHIFKTVHLKSIFSNCIITKEYLLNSSR